MSSATSPSAHADLTRTGADRRPTTDALIHPKWLIGGLFAILGAQNLLLLRFLGVESPLLFLVGAAGLVAVCLAAVRGVESATLESVKLRTSLFLAGLALLLCLLGGEGRLFYANYDWQIRDAVLADMIRQPWPFAYTARGEPEVLRAPIGMFLFPALVGKAFGLRAADWALLAQNTLALTVLLALGTTLFRHARKRVIGLLVAVWFSGMDVFGLLFMRAIGRSELAFDHIEPWASLQYSSNITLLFWVPQHALAGWFGAVLFLLHRAGAVRLGVFLASVPLLALWSPLSVLGLLPFAAVAGLTALAKRRLTAYDFLLPAIATLLALASAAYLSAGGDSVGTRLQRPSGLAYLAIQLFEVLPFVVAALMAVPRSRFGRAPVVIAAACLLVLPFIQIGTSVDLMMRGSIPALTIVAVAIGEALGNVDRGASEFRRLGAMALVVILAVGAVTPTLEIRRALVTQPSPLTACSLIRSWDTVTKLPASTPKSTYLAPVTSLPTVIQPDRPRLVFVHPAEDPPTCWPRPWRVERRVNS